MGNTSSTFSVFKIIIWSVRRFREIGESEGKEDAHVGSMIIYLEHDLNTTFSEWDDE